MKRRREDVQGGNHLFQRLCYEIEGVCNLTELNLMGFMTNNDGIMIKKLMIKAQKYSAFI